MDDRPEIRSLVEAELLVARVSPEGLVWITSRHFVLPAVFSALRRHRLLHLLPDDLVLYLEDIYNLNLVRNNRILEQAMEIARALHKEGIRPLFLKGSAQLLQHCYYDTGDRIMIDIDLLVELQSLGKAVQILSGIGYGHDAGYSRFDPGVHHHFPVLHKPGGVAGVEIHHRVTHPGYMSCLPTALILREAVPVLSGMAAVMDMKHQLMLHFFHDQLVHWQFENRAQSLRGLYDFYLLSRQLPPADVGPMTGRHRQKFNAFCQLTARTFSYPDTLPFSRHWYSGYYLFTWDLLNHPARISGWLHVTVRKWNRMIYLTRFVLGAFHRSDRRKVICQRIKEKSKNFNKVMKLFT